MVLRLCVILISISAEPSGAPLSRRSPLVPPGAVDNTLTIDGEPEFMDDPTVAAPDPVAIHVRVDTAGPSFGVDGVG